MEKRKQKSFPLMLTLAVLVLFMLYQAIGCFPVHARAPVVVINPGHSVGTDPGATNTVTYVQEADLNAAIAAKTAERLKSQGYEVYLTQPVSGCSIPSLLPNISDSNSLVKVANAINAKNPDLALAIHHNSDGNKSGGSASGYELYWSSYRDFDNVGVYEVSGLWGGGLTAFRDNSPCYAAQQSEVFAGMVKSALDGFDIKYNKTVERDDYLPAHTRCPSILFEGGYVSNDSESRLLANDWHQNATADRLVNAINAYFGRYGDTEAPIADSVTTPESSTTNTVFTVTANNVSDKGAGVKNVRFAVWTSKNGQDDIQWNDGKNDGNGNWSYQIDINDHDEQFGEYIVHVYAMDFAGNDGFIGDVSISVTSNNNAPSGISCMQLSNTLYKVYAKGFSDYSGYQFPVWSNNGGQDDIIWYQGIRQTDGSYASIIDIKDHGHDVGDYTVHVYANNGGKTELLGATGFNVKTMTAESVTASEVKDGKFTVTISGINAPSGIREIQVPTWSDNGGQDDIVWYGAKRKDEKTYTLEVDIKNHGYDVGKYLSHVYGIDKNGKQIFLGSTSTNVAKMTAESVTASEVKDGKFTVTISGINAPSGIREIQVPTWSDNGGQDDIVWYGAKRKDGKTYTLEVDIKNHGYDVGKYLSHVYGTDQNGKMQFLGNISIWIEEDNIPDNNSFSTKTSIIGNTTKSAQELADYFNSKAAFPTSFYGMSAVDFANIYIEECRTEGVRTEVAFAQMCLETGYLQYGGDVKREQFNFAGIGATGNGASGNSFADVRTGIRAQVQHLKAYASTEGLVNECVDPRYQYVNKGCAPTVGDLAGKWATDPNYGNKLVTIMNAF